MQLKTTLLFILCLGGSTLFAQPWSDLLNPHHKSNTDIPAYRLMMEDVHASWYDVEAAYKAHWLEQGTAPTNGARPEFRRYLDFMKANSDDEGYYQARVRQPDYWQKIQNSRNPSTAPSSAANWTPIGPIMGGPTKTGNNSRMHSIYVDPNNSNNLWAGAGTAGVWKSTDGGMNWVCISMTMPEAKSIRWVQPDRTNHDHIIISSGHEGIFRTTDGGLNWTKSPQFNASIKVMQHPTIDTVWLAATGNGLYNSTDNGANWTNLYGTEKITDIEFHPTNSDTLYILQETNTSVGEFQAIYRSLNGGATFSQLSNGVPADSIDLPRAEIAVTPAAPDYVYATFSGVNTSGEGLWGVYLSRNLGDNFEFRCCGAAPGAPYSSTTEPNILGYGTGGNSGGQLNYQQALYVSPMDTNIVYSGGVFIWKSVDMGASWTKVTNSYHADNHALHIKNDTIWTATDGGISIAVDSAGISFTPITNGIFGTEFIGDFGFSRKKEGNMVGGTIHNGTLGTYAGAFPGWTQYAGGDLKNGFIDGAQNVFRVGTNSGGNKIARSKDQTASFQTLPTASKFINTNPHKPSVLFAPDVGLYNLWKSEDDGPTWTKLTNFSTTSSVEIEDIQICESAPNNIALNLHDSREIAISRDGGLTWAVSPIPPHGSRRVEDLIMDHMDSLTMWIVYDREFVYKTTDGGTTWLSYNTGIDPSANLRCITNHTGSNGAVYLGGANVIYYRDNSQSSWTSYDIGMPTYFESKDIDVIYDINKIRVSTNRSVWESDLNSTALPKASISSSVVLEGDCGSSTYQFYDASFVPTAGTTWEWTLPGSVTGTSTDQNPEVIYNTVGTFDVSLKITNAGISDSITLPNFVTLSAPVSTSIPIYEDIENFTFTGTPACNPSAALGGSLTNMSSTDFPADGGDWQVNAGKGKSSRSGPLIDYTEMTDTSHYLYLRGTSGCGTETAAILMDCIDLGGMIQPSLFFAYNAHKTNGTPTPELHVDILSNGVWQLDELLITGEHGARTGTAADWALFTLDLSAYTNQFIKIRIWGTTSTNSTSCDMCLDGITVYDAGAIYLTPQLALSAIYDSGSGLMHDSLRSQGLIPAHEPYTALGLVGESVDTVAQSVFMTTGNDAIVDWVFIEVRDKMDSTLVVSGRPALLQADGDVVDVDGISSVRIEVSPDDYFLAIHHRNHLAVMTQDALSFDGIMTVVDFRNTPTHGTNTQAYLGGGIFGLWAGDGNRDGKVVYQGANSDLLPSTTEVYSDIGNTSNSATHPVFGYLVSDLNMDGKVLYLGTDNDRAFLEALILGHYGNVDGEVGFIIWQQF